jgi:hypothetical protein
VWLSFRTADFASRRSRVLAHIESYSALVLYSWRSPARRSPAAVSEGKGTLRHRRGERPPGTTPMKLFRLRSFDQAREFQKWIAERKQISTTDHHWISDLNFT